MYFGSMLEELTQSRKARRSSWDENVYIYLVPSSTILEAGEIKAIQIKDRPVPLIINAHIDMVGSDGSITIGWVPSQADMLTDDWMIVE